MFRTGNFGQTSSMDLVYGVCIGVDIWAENEFKKAFHKIMIFTKLISVTIIESALLISIECIVSL